MNAGLIASRISIHRRYVRAVDLARDVGDPEALEGYIVTPPVRDAVIRVFAGLSVGSRQRAFRIVGPYGAGKSAFGVFLAHLLMERGFGPASKLLSESIPAPIDDLNWRPVIIVGRRVSFTRELLHTVQRVCEGEPNSAFVSLKAQAESLLEFDGVLDSQAVITLLTKTASEVRQQTGAGLILLVDEMGLFLEHSANSIGVEDPSIFQMLADCVGGRSEPDLSVVGFLHHRFVDYVAGMGSWIEAEWSKFSQRYEEIAFDGSTEQSLYMLAQALKPNPRHSSFVRKQAEKLFTTAVDRNLFAISKEDMIQVAGDLYPLHPTSIATICSAVKRFGQNERSLFSFLLSLEPSSLKRFFHETRYAVANWYTTPLVFDYLAATIGNTPKGDQADRWSLALEALATTNKLTGDHESVLKTVALIAVLEPVPGIIADPSMIAWSLGMSCKRVQRILADLAELNVIYRRPYRGDYSLWSRSSVDLSRWLDEAKVKVRVPARLKDISNLLTSRRPVVAHRHYHATGTLRTFEVTLWTGENIQSSDADGMVLIVPVYPGADYSSELSDVEREFKDNPLVVICARAVLPEDLKWAHELALWCWIRDNCEELKLDGLARSEVASRITAAERELYKITAIISSATSVRKEMWRHAGATVSMPKKGLSTLLSNICDGVFDRTPVLKNELINRRKLSSAVASARMRLLGRMLNHSADAELDMEGTPPERTIYLSLFQESGIHFSDSSGQFAFGEPIATDPCRWKPAWNSIADRLKGGEIVRFDSLIQNLERPPFGLRSAPALLVIAAYILAKKDSVAIMERNSFQPELTVAHFMRLAKNPKNFALRSIPVDEVGHRLVCALATRLHIIDESESTIVEISEKLFNWYNLLPQYALKTQSLPHTTIAVRDVLRKAKEPATLFLHDLPTACNALKLDGQIEDERYVESLAEALLELDEATPLLRSRALAVVSKAFGTNSLSELRDRIQEDFEPRRLKLGDYHLRVFVDRALNRNVSDEQWLDSVAGHLTGQRLSNWMDGKLDQFEFEVRVIAGNLMKWLALSKAQEAHGTDLRSIHVVGIDGQEKVIFVRQNKSKLQSETRMRPLRKALGNDPEALQTLGNLLVEYVENDIRKQKKKEEENLT